MEQLEILPNIHLGFTGTRWGMGDVRIPIVSYLAKKLNPAVAHHGMCKGADTEFHNIIRELESKIWIVGHPPLNKKTYIQSDCDELWTEKEYIERDKDVVDQSHILIATPQTGHEVLRSGSWTTVRYARKGIKSGKGKCKRIYVVAPDGKVSFIDHTTFGV